MHLWPRSTADQIYEAFGFLTDRGYRLIADSPGGMGGSVTYRSAGLWIAVEWDRSEPWIEFAPTHASVGRVHWEVVDHLLRGAEHWEHGTAAARTAPAVELAAWLHERLANIEALFRMPELEQTNKQIQAVLTERRAFMEERWKSSSRPASP